MAKRKSFDAVLEELGRKMDAEKEAKTKAIAELLGPPRDGTTLDLELSRLSPDPFHSRRSLDLATIVTLAASLQEHGVLQPLIVRAAEGPDSPVKYWIVAGLRRFMAAQIAGLKRVPCVIRTFTNEQALAAGLIENLHRSVLADTDRAEIAQTLADQKAGTQLG